MKTGFDGLSWTYSTSYKMFSSIEKPGLSFIGMTQLETFIPKIYSKLVNFGGGLFDRMLLVTNPAPKRLLPDEKKKNIAELKKYPVKNLW